MAATARLEGTALEAALHPRCRDQNVDVALFTPDPVRQRLHLRRLEVVDLYSDTGAAEPCDQLRRLLDRFGPVVLGALGACRTADAVHSRAGFTEGGGNATAGAS